LELRNFGFRLLCYSAKETGEDLGPLRDFLTKTYGSDFNMAFKKLSMGRDSLSKHQFSSLAKKAGFEGNTEAVFQVLDDDGDGKISATEFMALDACNGKTEQISAFDTNSSKNSTQRSRRNSTPQSAKEVEGKERIEQKDEKRRDSAPAALNSTFVPEEFQVEKHTAEPRSPSVSSTRASTPKKASVPSSPTSPSSPKSSVMQNKSKIQGLKKR